MEKQSERLMIRADKKRLLSERLAHQSEILKHQADILRQKAVTIRKAEEMEGIR